MSDAKLGPESRGPRGSRGPHGDRGHRGHDGATGPTGPGSSGGGSSQILAGSITPPPTFGFVNDYSPIGGGAFARWRLESVGAPTQLRGILLDGSDGNVDGYTLYITNVGTTEPIVLENESGSSSPANRILTAISSAGGPQPLTIDPGGGAILQYDGSSLRWRVLGISTTTLPVTVIQGSLLQSGGFASLDKTILTSSVTFQGVATIVNASGTINDFNGPGFSTAHQLQVTTAGVIITGFVPQNAQEGDEFVIENLQASTGNIQINNDSGSSALGNRVLTPGGGALIIAPTHSATLMWNQLMTAWLVIAVT